MSTTAASANAEAIEAWNTFLFDKFLRFRPYVSTALASQGRACLDRFPPPPGARAVDLGCGFGDTTLGIARLVGPAGEAVGVDAAARFIALAAREAAEAGVENVRYITADIEHEDWGGGYDYAFSRFGIMFFANPVRALRNVRRSLNHGARFAACVWRRKDQNPWVYDVERRVLEIIPHPEKQDGQLTCGPGPFSMADPDLVSTQMLAAGFSNVTFERLDADICIGDSVEEAIALATALGPAGEVLRLAGEDAERKRPLVLAALRDLFEKYKRPEGVFGRSSCWLVSAVA